MTLRINTRQIEGVTVVDCSGRIVFGDDTVLLRDKVKELIGSTRQIVLNLAEVNYIDSGGLGTMVGLYTSARAAGGEVKLASLTRRVGDLLQVTKLLTVFEVHDTVEQAIGSFRSERAAAS